MVNCNSLDFKYYLNLCKYFLLLLVRIIKESYSLLLHQIFTQIFITLKKAVEESKVKRKISLGSLFATGESSPVTLESELLPECFSATARNRSRSVLE